MRNLQRLGLVAVLFSVMVVSLSGRAGAEELSRKEIYQRTLRGTALVVQSKGTGTGWVVDVAKKHLVTNAHVVGASESVLVLFPDFEDGRLIPERSHYSKTAKAIRGEVIVSDPRHDLALIKLESIPEGVTELKLAAESASPSDQTHSIGNPSASEALWVYTFGTVRQVYRRKVKFEDQEVDARVLETQAPINPGDSGGPVVNDRGELIGVSAAINRSGNLFSICIDVAEVKEFLNDVPRLLNPKLAADFIRAASFHFYKKKFDEALADYTEAIRLEPKAALPYRNRAVLFINKREYQKAVEDCTKAIELNPDDPHAYLIRSKAFKQLGDNDKSRKDIAQVERIDPTLVPKE
jgi:tetratricopeptide (TPR) repeat protein